jgi:hypothetical protein
VTVVSTYRYLALLAKGGTPAPLVVTCLGFPAEIGFDVERVKNGGLKFKLGPINIGGSGSSTSTTGNKIKVSFEEKDTK